MSFFNKVLKIAVWQIRQYKMLKARNMVVSNNSHTFDPMKIDLFTLSYGSTKQVVVNILKILPYTDLCLDATICILF